MRKKTEAQKKITRARLKRCPWCGTYPVVEPWHGGGPEKTAIGCVSTRCHVCPSTVAETPEQAMRQWNNRRGDL